jgi:murein DD-endopeptidase MepM/ murein hydrolase activator NlpD
VLVVVAVLLAPPLAAHASPESDRQAEIQAEIDQLRGELDEVAADEAEALADLRVTQRRKQSEEAKLADLDKVMTAAMAELAVAESKLDGALAAEQAAHHKFEAVQGDLESARDTLKDQAVASFMRYGSGAEQLDVLLQSEDINELHHAKAFVDALAETQSRIVARFAALQQDSAALEATAQEARNAAEAQKAEVESRAAALQSARDAQASTTASVDAEAAHEETLLASLRGQRSAYERRIRDQQRESDAIADLLRRRGSGGATISGHGSLSSPLANPVITSTYGYRVHPIFGDRRLHTGIDLRAASGTPIKAAAPGEVVFAGWRGGYGNCTIIDHGGGVATLYAHQSALKVAQGDEVSRGQVIGAAGATGNATGPHLHFEVRVNGVPVDPMPYL